MSALMVRRAAKALLSSLGRTPDAMAGELARRQIRGERYSWRRCPLAALLVAELAPLGVIEARVGVWSYPFGTELVTAAWVTAVQLPDPADHFVLAFDQGAYPALRSDVEIRR